MTRLITTTALAAQPYPDEALMLMAAPFVIVAVVLVGGWYLLGRK